MIHYNAWVLSGGGAKGCFQAGSIYYLGGHNLEFKPNIIAGTSVGALNSLLPAQEWEWPLQNIADLIDIWLGLESESDMFEKSEDVISFDEDRFNETLTSAMSLDLGSLASFVLGGQYSPEESEYGDYDIEFFKSKRDFSSAANRRRKWSLVKLIGRIGTAVFVPGHAIGGSIAIQTGAQLNNLKEDFEKIKSFFSLKPIANLISEKLDYDKFSNNYATLKLVSTSIASGKVVYMDRELRLKQIDYAPDETVNDSDKKMIISDISYTGAAAYRGSNIDRLIKGALASAAIPVAFPPILIDGQICFDGGVTDHFPLRTIIPELEENAIKKALPTQVILIRCNPKANNKVKLRKLLEEVPRGRPSDLNKPYGNLYSDKQAESASLFDYLGKLVGGMKNENRRTDDLELEKYKRRTNIKTYDISPTFGVNGTAQIDPGLIRIQLAYGWMRAFDSIQGNMRSHELTDKIILSRLHAWRLEELSNSIPITAGIDRLFLPGAIPKIRQMKVHVHKHVLERIDEFGRESMPRHNDLHFGYDETWFNKFEKHVWETNRTPFDHWIEMNKNVVPSGPPIS